MDVRLYYPPTSKERYAPDVEDMAKRFPVLLFEPDHLGEIVHPLFQEFLTGKGLHLNGLAALQKDRRRFGQPVLRRVNFLLVPPSKATFRLGPYYGRFTFDALMELTFDIPYSSLMPEWREGLSEGDVVPAQLRLREPTYSRLLTAHDLHDEPLLDGVPVGTRMIFERSHWPYLVNRMGQPQDQIGHVGEQAGHYAQHRTPMYKAPFWTPTWVAYNEIMEDKFNADPTAN